MRMMVSGLTGWAKMKSTTNETVKVTDTAITVVGTLLVVMTWTLLR